MIKIKQAWYMPQIMYQAVAELPDNSLVMFRIVPLSTIKESEFKPYKGHHPNYCKAQKVPEYVLRLYGLEIA